MLTKKTKNKKNWALISLKEIIMKTFNRGSVLLTGQNELQEKKRVQVLDSKVLHLFRWYVPQWPSTVCSPPSADM